MPLSLPDLSVISIAAHLRHMISTGLAPSGYDTCTVQRCAYLLKRGRIRGFNLFYDWVSYEEFEYFV